MDVFKERVEKYALSNEELSQLTDQQYEEYQQHLARIKELEHDRFVMDNSVRIARQLNNGFKDRLNGNKKHQKITEFFDVGIVVMAIVYFATVLFCG